MLTHALPHLISVLALQVISQLVPSHVGIPDPSVGPEHFRHPLVPHALIEVLLTQAPLQSCSPDGHTHAPFTQLWPLPHGAPQRPQLFASLFVSTHAPEHSVRLPVHIESHWPFEQIAIAFATVERQGEHSLPHVATSVSLTQFPSQSCVPAPHSQRPWLQLAPLGHFVPQPPQFATSVFVSTHALPHAMNSPAHLNPHAPASHVTMARATSVLHACSHEPQCIGSV